MSELRERILVALFRHFHGIVGRWCASEHELFIKGLEKYGKDWKAIAADVGSTHVSVTRRYRHEASCRCVRMLRSISRNCRPW